MHGARNDEICNLKRPHAWSRRIKFIRTTVACNSLESAAMYVGEGHLIILLYYVLSRSCAASFRDWTDFRSEKLHYSGVSKK